MPGRVKKYTKEYLTKQARYYQKAHGVDPGPNSFAKKELERLTRKGDTQAEEMLKWFNDDPIDYGSYATIMNEYGSFAAYLEDCGIESNAMSKLDAALAALGV